MSNTSKTFEELDVIDDFLMNAIATDPEVGEPFCRTVLSVLLQKKIGRLRIVAQKTIPAYIPGLRGIRMDVEIEEELAGEEQTKTGPSMNIYDMEPHLQRGMNFPRHNRFYQAKIDSRLMKSGETDFSKLPNLYVLTITNFDIFGKDYMMYHFRNRCEEVPDLEYDDGLQFIYFYTDGSHGGSAEIKAMLRYLQRSTESNVTSDATRKVHEYVNRVKVLPEVKKEFMRFDELMAYAKQEGMRLGLEEGREKGLEEGREKGLEEGRVKGLEEGRVKGLEEGREKGLEEGRIKGREEGLKEGQVNSIITLLESHGEVDTALRRKLESEKNADKLHSWLKLAAKAETVDEFIEKM